MARKSTSPNGRDRLEEAMATLIQNQAAFVAQLAETNRAQLEYKRESDERFARIEAQMAEIIRVLNEHGRLLERLPEAVRDKYRLQGSAVSRKLRLPPRGRPAPRPGVPAPAAGDQKPKCPAGPTGGAVFLPRSTTEDGGDPLAVRVPPAAAWRRRFSPCHHTSQ
jgi:hypothetical protein